MALTLTGLVGFGMIVAGTVLITQGKQLTGGRPSVRHFQVSAGPFRFKFSSTMPGFLVVSFGVLLIVVDMLTGR